MRCAGVALVVCWVLSGCSDSQGGAQSGPASGGTGGELGTRFEGIYTFDELTRNQNDCTPGMESLRDVIDDSHLVAQRGVLQGFPMVTLASCAGPTACRDLATLLVESPTAGTGLTYVFMTAGPDDTLLGRAVHYGVNDGTQCSSAGVEEQVLGRVGNVLTLEQRAHLTTYPVDANGECTHSAASMHGVDAPCSSLRILTGTFVEPL